MPIKATGSSQFRFFRTPLGYLLKAVMFWLIGFWLFLLATDSGSILEWLLVIVCLIWGLWQFYDALKASIIKVWKTQNKRS